MTDTNQKLREAHDYKQANGSMNCMQCAAAYMLGFPVEMVPDFALHEDATLAWDAFHAFFKTHGYAALMLPSTHAPESDYLASGSTSRGTKHIVVMNDGELVFDPHPSNAGLSKIDCIYVIARQALALPTAAPDMPLSMNQFGRLVELTREHLTDNTFVYKATSKAGDICHFGVESAAKAWAKGGTVEAIKVREFKLHTSGPTADHIPDAGEMVVDHFPDATKMIETAAPVGDREAFERTMMDKFGWQRNDFKLDDFGYFDGHTDTAWMAWQARAALSAQAVPDKVDAELKLPDPIQVPDLDDFDATYSNGFDRGMAHGWNACLKLVTDAAIAARTKSK